MSRTCSSIASKCKDPRPFPAILDAVSLKVCAHCGEMFEEDKLACPHCGADADLTWSEAPVEADYEGVGYTEGDEAYEETLEREGLAPDRTTGDRKGCAGAVLLGLFLSATLADLLL